MIAAARRAACLLLLSLAVATCTAERPPLPLDSPQEDAAGAGEARPPEPDRGAAAPSIEEEPLPDEAPPPGGAPAPSAAFAVSDPPVLDTIDGSTPPNVAAATRLVDAARTRMAAGDSGAALDQLERAIAIDPANPYAYCYLAQLHFAHRSYDQAIAFAARAAALSGAQAPQWASRAYTLQGNALEAIGRFADARAAYAHAVEITPANLAAQTGLARLSAPAEGRP